MRIRDTLSVALCVIVSLILLAIATRYIHPHWLFASIHSLQLHAAAACAVAMLMALCLHRNIAGVALLAVSLGFCAHALVMTRDFVSVMGPDQENAPTFKLMSFNILTTNDEGGAAIAAMIAASGADIVNVMEAEPLLPHLPAIETAYPYRIGCGVMDEDCDQLMLSKTPLENGLVRSLSDVFGNRFILAETRISGRKIHVGGIHTTKPYFDDFQTLELFRASQVLSWLEGPLVLSGDFNASSLAPNMRDFLGRSELKTASWEPATWPVQLGMFGLPIDHIYARSPLAIKSLKVLDDTQGSNHAGLIAEIALPAP